jgi:hypothetical protein
VPEILGPDYSVVSTTPPLSPDVNAPAGATAREEMAAKFRLAPAPQLVTKIGSMGFDPDPNFSPYAHMDGYEHYADTLGYARSQSEFSALKAQIDKNNEDRRIAASGPVGMVGDMIVGLADPANLIPIPAVKGIGMLKGALAMGASFGLISAADELVRQYADPTATAEESFYNISLGTLMGGVIGVPVGHWGAAQTRALRAFEQDISAPDSPNFSLKPRDDAGMHYEYARRASPNPDGSYPRYKIENEIVGYEPKTLDGVRYISEDGVTWVPAAQEGRAELLAVSDDIAEQLGQPVPVERRTMFIDEAGNKAEHDRAQWHDELQAAIDDGTPVDRVILDGNDFSNYRTYEHLAEQASPIGATESPADYRLRIGKMAMRELRASKLRYSYAGPRGLAWIAEKLNFSPVVKMMNVFTGDNYLADLALRVGGDYGWAIAGNRFGWSTPPSMLLKGMEHTPRFHAWQSEFDVEFLKLVSGNSQATGATFQGKNLSAAGYAVKQGLRRKAGANVLTKGDFEEMVARAVFEKGDFEVNGFPVNENARRAAKGFTRMMQEYDELHRATGNFRDQKNLTRDLKHWEKERTRLSERLLQWAWGPTGSPTGLRHAIRVNVPERTGPGLLTEPAAVHIFEGDSHAAAIQVMIAELGDEGIRLSEQLGPDNYGFVYPGRPTSKPPARLPGGPDPAGSPPSPPAGSPPPAPHPIDAVVRTSVEQEARWNELADKMAGGAATPDEIAEHKALTKVVIDNMAREMGLFRERPYEDVHGVDSLSYDPELAGFRTIGDVLDHIRQNTEDFGTTFSGLIDRIFEDVKDIRLNVIDQDTLEAAMAAGSDDMLGRGALGVFDPVSNEARVRGWMGHVPGTEGMLEAPSGTNPVVITHEAVHAATNRRIEQGLLDRRQGNATPYAEMVTELEGLRDEFFELATRDRERLVAGLDMAGRMDVDHRLGLIKDDIHEFLTYATTEPRLREFLQATPARRPRGMIKTLWDEIVHLYMRLTGKAVPTRADQLQMEQLFDVISRYTEMQQPLMRGEVAPGVKAMEAPPDGVGHGFTLSKDAPGLLGNQPDRMPAIRYEGRIFTGGDHATAIEAARQHLGDEFEMAFDENPEAYLGYYREPPFKPLPKAMLARADQEFILMADALEQRMRQMSPEQRRIFDQRAAALQDATDMHAVTAEQLKIATEMPHQFLDANGNPEPHYPRQWDKSEGAVKREQLTRLIEKWYERDNPSGARERAEETVDNILNTDPWMPGQGEMSALNQRSLNIPNSWKINDPQFGEIRVSDFINKNILEVGEHYIRKSGIQIEAARMFGDSQLKGEKVRMREYMLKRYWEPETTEAGRRAVMRKINEAEGWLDIIHKSVLGTLKTTDPWRADNRMVRFMKTVTELGVMGKVAISSLGEVMRPGMSNGFGVYFNAIFTRYLDDLERMRGNIEFGGLSGELADLNSKVIKAGIVAMNEGEPMQGGTAFERWLVERMPGFYKLTGLTSLTTWQKSMTMFAAQHSVMDESRKIAASLLAGQAPDQKMVLRMAALGIGPRDALLLARMPIEHYQGGKLILPSVDAWKRMGPDGRRARELLLNAIHGEARRVVVTPSIGDRSTVFNGVWTSGGKVVAQTDIMTLPMQFLSYAMGAHNKMLVSAFQGRDRNTVGGLFSLYLMGIFAGYLATPSEVWRRKTYDQIMLDAYDKSGIGGFWLNNLNGMIERASNDRFGLHALFGVKPTYKSDRSDLQAAIAAAGAAPSHFADVSRAFWDSSISGTKRAQLIRKGILYNGVLPWSMAFDWMSSEAGDAMGGRR